MGIQDRDYWRERYNQNDSTEQQSNGSGQPPRKVYSNSAGLLEPKKNGVWEFLRRPWVMPFLWGTAVGRSWESLKGLGQLFYERFFSAFF